jgi:hypothetical protein
MSTSIVTYNTPEAVVKISNISLNPKDRKATLVLATKEKGKRKFIEEEIIVSLTAEVYHWFTQLKDDVVKEVADNPQGFVYTKTGTKSTTFQRYLKRLGIEFAPGVLQTMSFESDNKSESYADNPFRIIRYTNGSNSITLVNVPSKKTVEKVDLSTGEVKSSYYQKYGKLNNGQNVKAFIMPKMYRRLVIQTTRVIVEYVNS